MSTPAAIDQDPATQARVVVALAGRALRVQFRRAQFLIPSFLLPLVLLAVIASGTSSARNLPGFPSTGPYIGFVVGGTLMQGALLAGITAGIDLALAMIEEVYGSETALGVAREMVVYLKRSGGQEQYSEPLRFQAESTDPLAALEPWLRGHLRQDLSVEALARRAG